MDSNFPQESLENTRDSAIGGAESGALGADSVEFPPDLHLVVDARGTLPEAIQADILAMVRAQRG